MVKGGTAGGKGRYGWWWRGSTGGVKTQTGVEKVVVVYGPYCFPGWFDGGTTGYCGLLGSRESLRLYSLLWVTTWVKCFCDTPSCELPYEWRRGTSPCNVRAVGTRPAAPTTSATSVLKSLHFYRCQAYRREPGSDVGKSLSLTNKYKQRKIS